MGFSEKGDEVVSAAIKEGFSTILKQHPRFKGQESYLFEHIDSKRVNEEIRYVESYIKHEESRRGREISDEDKLQLFYEKLAQGAASGRLFDDAGKEVILKKSLEERARHGPRIKEARGFMKGEQRLDNVIVAFKDLYTLMKTGDYAHHMPELARAVTTVYDMGFLNSSIDLLGHYGIVNRENYKILKSSVHAKVQEGVRDAEEAVECYSSKGENKSANYSPQGRNLKKAAAVALGLSGLGILMAGNSAITGNVVGIGDSAVASFLGVASIIIAGILFLTSLRRKR